MRSFLLVISLAGCSNLPEKETKTPNSEASGSSRNSSALVEIYYRPVSDSQSRFIEGFSLSGDGVYYRGDGRSTDEVFAGIAPRRAPAEGELPSSISRLPFESLGASISITPSLGAAAAFPVSGSTYFETRRSLVYVFTQEPSHVVEYEAEETMRLGANLSALSEDRRRLLVEDTKLLAEIRSQTSLVLERLRTTESAEDRAKISAFSFQRAALFKKNPDLRLVNASQTAWAREKLSMQAISKEQIIGAYEVETEFSAEYVSPHGHGGKVLSFIPNPGYEGSHADLKLFGAGHRFESDQPTVAKANQMMSALAAARSPERVAELLSDSTQRLPRLRIGGGTRATASILPATGGEVDSPVYIGTRKGALVLPGRQQEKKAETILPPIGDRRRR